MKHVNTFAKGLDKDTNVNSYTNDTYPYALNLRVLSDDTLESGTLTNMEDSKAVVNIHINEKVVGVSTMRNNAIIFTKSTIVNNKTGSIYMIPENVLLNTDSTIDFSLYKKVENDFDFGDNVQIVARHETDDIQKIYWVDNKNLIRFANLSDVNINNLDIFKFNIIPMALIEGISPYSIDTGLLPVGMHQYAFCFFSPNGVETAYSPATRPIMLSKHSLHEINSLNFRGSNIGENSNKGIKLKCTVASSANLRDYNLSHIRIIRLSYVSPTQLPEVTIVYEGINPKKPFYFTDTGGINLGSLILEDFRYIPNIFRAKTLETKNDFLFAGNITEEKFDIDFDARAYRFNSNGVGVVTNTDDFTNLDDLEENVDYIKITDSSGKFNTIPENFTFSPCNKIKDSDKWWYGDDAMIYQKDGISVGGEGPNISYSFFFKTRYANTSDNDYSVYHDHYEDLASPITMSVGFQRSEIYRFGIVFFDIYLRSSFVKWIGDIRIPDEFIGEEYAIITYDKADTIQDINITFEMSDSTRIELNNKGAYYWQIVRAERTYDDATVKDCGYISSLDKNGRMDNNGQTM